MVIFWSGNWGGRRGGRRPGRRLGPGGYSGHYRGHYGGGGYGGGGYGPPPGYGRYRRRSGGDGSCLRDLLLLNTGCCLANAIGCGVEMLLVAPTTARQVRTAGRGSGRLADRLVAAVRVYQREVSPRRPPCCSFTPTCSAYAVEALETHGARRGSWLALRRLVRCHPRALGGLDQVPAAG